MPEPQTDTAAELETLRRTNGELVAKNATRKQHIADLEKRIADLESENTTVKASLRQVTIDGPLEAISKSISSEPELWREIFSKSYRLELVDGTLTILSAADDKPIQVDGKPIPFELESLKKLLLDEKHPHSKLFNTITIVSKASGAGALDTQKRAPVATPKPSTHKFGLR